MTFFDPKTPKEAPSGPNTDKWREAMQLVIASLIGNGTWELVDRPPNTNIVSYKWVFKVKYDSEGEVEKFKARLAGRGFSQRYAALVNETAPPLPEPLFPTEPIIEPPVPPVATPVIKQQSVQFLLALGLHLEVEIIHMDVPQAYVKAGQETEI
ncbi:hypothetical protein AeRB84_013111 [Aphanomyces euteiches]|nr:hypothetical protein AeRB84_013111 [Aphanomyces euteiches]